MQGRGTTERRPHESHPTATPELNSPEPVVDLLPCSFFVTDHEGRLLRWNRDFRRLIEYSDGELGSMRILDVVDSECRGALAEAMNRAFEGDPIRMDVICRARSGRAIPLFITAQRATVEAGTCLIVVGTEDVWRKPAAQQSAERSVRDERNLPPASIDNLPDAMCAKGRWREEDAYRAIVDHSFHGLIVVQDGKVVFANRATEEITGYSVQEIVSSTPESVRDFVHPLDRDRVWQSHEARLRGEHLPDQYEFRVTRKDGSTRWVQIHTSRVEYRGRPAIQACFRDTTERRPAEAALRRSEARNQALLNANPDLMFRLSRGGVFLDCKPPKDDALSVSPTQFIGKHLEDVYPAGLTRALMHCIEMAVQTGRVQTLEYALPDADSGASVFECRVVACAEQEVVAIVRDISDRIRAEHLAELQRDLAIRLSSLSDLKEGLQHCLEAAVKASQMDCGGLYTVDPQDACFRLAAHVGLSNEFTKRADSHSMEFQETQCILNRGPVYGTYGTLGLLGGPAQQAETLRAAAIIPIRHNDQVIACLSVASHTSDDVPPWSRVVLETIAAQIGSALSRLKIQELLRRSEQEKAVILNTLPQIVIYHDLAHRMIWANRTAVEAIGKSVEEIVGRPCYEVWSGRTEPCAGCPADLALRTGCSQEAEIIGYDEGSWLMRGEPVRDEHGQLLGVVEHALNITSRKRHEEELRRRLQFEGLVTSISTYFASLRADELDKGIQRALADVGHFVDADHCSVLLLQDGGTRMHQAYEWFSEGIDPKPSWIRDVETRQLPWGMEQLRQSRVLNIPSVRELQGQAADAKGLLETMGVKSLLCGPIVIGGKLFGFLDIAVVRRERTWPDDAVQLLKITAEILANALERKRSADLMQERLAFETLLSDLSAAFINLPVDELDQEIERWLARIGISLGTDRGAIIHVSGRKAMISHSWVAEGRTPPAMTMDNINLDWSMKQLRRGDVLAYGCIEDAPPEAQWEKEYCRRNGIQSILVMPLEAAGLMLGILMFSSMRARREWPDELTQRLRLLAQVFANAMLRRRAEEALRSSESRLRSIVRTTPAGIGLVSNRIMLEVNDRVCEMVGYPREDLTNQDARMLYPTQEEYEYVGRENIRQIEERGEGMTETRWKRRDGSIIHVLLHSTPLDAADLSKGIIYAAMDITERKHAEAALRESEQNYREVFNAANDAVLIHDPVTGDILDVNKTMLDVYGFSYEEALRVNVGMFSSGEPPFTQQEALAHIRKAVAEGPRLFEWHARKKNGELFWQEVNLRTATIGGKLRVLAVARDITDRKKAETQAQQHLAELTRAWHANMLGEMASGLAHELNQPLCAIVNYSNGCLRLTRRRDYSMETVVASIEQIAAQAQRAADIVKRIRGLIGRRDPQRTLLNLGDVLADAVHMLRDEAMARNVAIITRVQADLPRVRGDDVEIEQVVLNLMRNAIEAMNDPKIIHRNLTVSSRLTERHEIEVSVADTGRGILPGVSERIFESFFTTKPGGMGIGLSLSRRIIEAHDGRLWAESDGGSGATFRFTLPVEGDIHGDGQSGCVHRG